MPQYLGKEVSDEYLQELIQAYRDGQKNIGGDDAIERTDSIVIERLEAENVISALSPSAYNLGEQDAEDDDEDEEEDDDDNDDADTEDEDEDEDEDSDDDKGDV